MNVQQVIFVCGARILSLEKHGPIIWAKLDSTLKVHPHDALLVNGAAPGGDTIAVKWAEDREVHKMPFPYRNLDTTRYKRRTPLFRNSHMCVYLEGWRTRGVAVDCLGFPNPNVHKSGTHNMIWKLTQAGFSVDDRTDWRGTL